MKVVSGCEYMGTLSNMEDFFKQPEKAKPLNEEEAKAQPEFVQIDTCNI